MELCHVGLVLEVEADGVLAAVKSIVNGVFVCGSGAPESRSEFPFDVAGGGFDLDDACALSCQNPAAGGSRDISRKFNYGNTFQKFHKILHSVTRVLSREATNMYFFSANSLYQYFNNS